MAFKKLLLLSIFVLLGLLFSYGAGQAQIWLYSVNDNDPNQLTRVDITDPTPALTVVANKIRYGADFGSKDAGDQVKETEGAACDPRENTAYIVSNQRGPSLLLTLDVATGLAYGIGSTGVKDINNLAFLPFDRVNGLTTVFDGSSVEGLYGIASNQDRLFKIDKTTGVATPYPEVITTDHVDLEGLVFTYGPFNGDGWPPVLLAISESNGRIYDIDYLGSGQGTYIGTAIDGNGDPVKGLEGLEFVHGWQLAPTYGDAYLGKNFLFANTTRETAPTHIFLIDLSTGPDPNMDFPTEDFANSLIMDGEALLLKDGLIPVELLSFSAAPQSDAVVLSWSTATETENLGFYIYRSSRPAGEYEQVTGRMIPGAGNSSRQQQYSWVDAGAVAGQGYYYKLADIDYNGKKSFHGPVYVEAGATPENFALAQNYPNPFNPSTKISFVLPQAGTVHLSIFNTAGQLVRTLHSGEMSAGSHVFLWDGTDARGIRVASGVYLYRLQAGDRVLQKKMLLAK